MISVLVFGQPYTASRIARLLNSRPKDVLARYVPLRAYPRHLVVPRGSDRNIIMRVGYRVGATTRRGLLFDAFWSMLCRSMPTAARCHYWIGTDVFHTLEEVRAGTIRGRLLASARDDLHLTVAPWLTSELGSLGISATTALLPAAIGGPLVAPALPVEFSVLTYLPEARSGFYGRDAVLAAARLLPDVRFDIIGSRADRSRATPINVRWHGWVADMAQRYAYASVVVRIPRHDGFGNTVIEALLNARHVVYTYEVPFVHRLWPATGEGLATKLAGLRDAHASGLLRPNIAGRTYALEEFDEVKLADNLVRLIRDVHDNSSWSGS
jgi:hypothetical protein